MAEALPVVDSLPALNRRRAYLISLASFGAKGACAFLITYWLANSLRAEDLALWATMFSLGMILSVADLGVGQLILTTFHEGDGGGVNRDRLMTNSVGAMVILAGALFAAAWVVLSTQPILLGVRWKHLLIATILLRLVIIPYGAYLQALERYHERKVAEAVSYAAGAAFILWGVRVHADISVLLLGLNVILTLGSIALVVRAKALGVPSVTFSTITRVDVHRVFTESFPYFVNNVSGMAIYGGFIALSALVLEPIEVARLSLLHSLVFMHTFQVFDLVFRSVQPRMHDAALMRRLRLLVALSYGLSALGAAVIGVWLFAHFFHKYTYSNVELVVYTTFVFLEVYYLMITAAMQMRSALKVSLQWMSIAKAAAFVLLLVATWALGRRPALLPFSTILVAYSTCMAYVAWRIARRPVIAVERARA